MQLSSVPEIPQPANPITNVVLSPSLKILSFNARSLTHKLDYLLELVEERKPDIIVITETWLTSSYESSEFALSQYQMVRADRPSDHRGGGILIYFRIQYSVSLDSSVQSVLPTESVWCTVTSSSCSFVVGCIYRSPTGIFTSGPCLASDADSLLAAMIDVYCIKYRTKPIIILGDFNYPLINWSAYDFPSHLTKLRHVLELHDLTQHVHEPTRESAILDLLLTNRSDLFCSVTNLEPFHNSDHTVLEAIFRLHLPCNITAVVRQFRNYGKVDWDFFSSFLSNQPWHLFWAKHTVEQRWLVFKAHILTALDCCVPWKNMSTTGRKHPWFNQSIKRCRARKQLLWAAYKQSPSITALHAYRCARNALTATVRQEKARYEEGLAGRCKSDSKPFYNYARSRKSRTQTIPYIARADGSATQTQTETANALNDFFATVFTSSGASTVSLEDVLSPFGYVSQQAFKFDVQRVRYQLVKLNPRKATGPDGIASTVLRNSSFVLAPYLTSLFQLSLDEGALPSDWKTANVTPVHKSGRKDDANNYRPISLTSCVCKLMERFIHDWLIEFLNAFAPLNSSQHGFQRSQSCTTQLLEYVNDLTLALDGGLCVDVVYLDFSKAFDKVNHNLLIAKLADRAVPQRLIAWIQSFLTQRMQRVVLDAHFSDWTSVGSGVPQGSVLGPLLFNLYIDDLDSVLLSPVKVKKFADDTKIYVTYKPNAAVASAQTLQSSLDGLSQWCSKWQMKLNQKKCNVLHFGHNNPRLTYTIDGHKLEPTASIRDLGVTISSTGGVSEHCIKVAAQARKITGLMLRTFSSRKPSVVLPIFKTVIRPIVEYATPVWNPCLSKDIAEIERIQRKVTKCIFGMRNLSYDERLQRLGLPTLEVRRNFFDLIECYKIVHGLVRSDCHAVLTLSDCNTRGFQSKLKCTLHTARHNVRRHFFIERVLTLWNALPSEVVLHPTLSAFKCALRDHLKV